MLRYNLFGALIALVVLSTGAHAFGVYKTVDANGNVVYTDKPPENKNYDVIKTPATAPPPAKSPPATAPTDTPAAGSRGAKSATRANKNNANAPASTEPDPALEQAVIGVLGIENLVRQTETICFNAFPTHAKKYLDAADQWRQRNGDTVSLAQRVLALAFAAKDRQLIEAGIRSNNQQQLSGVTSAPTASKINWCDRSSGEIANGVMDVHNKQKFISPLQNYRVP